MQPVKSFVRIAAICGSLIACHPAFADANCEQLASLSTPAVEITKAEAIQSGSFTPPKGKPFGDLPPF